MILIVGQLNIFLFIIKNSHFIGDTDICVHSEIAVNFSNNYKVMANNALN